MFAKKLCMTTIHTYRVSPRMLKTEMDWLEETVNGQKVSYTPRLPAWACCSPAHLLRSHALKCKENRGSASNFVRVVLGDHCKSVLITPLPLATKRGSFHLSSHS